MPTSDEDLAKKADNVQKLREQVADAEAKRVERERAVSNDLTFAQLESEEAALRARLAAAREASKVTTVNSGAEAPLAAVKEQMEAAVAREQAVAATNEKGDK
jgi:acetylornithine/succinyldiaminopimelate/putrescine aminotransferase